MTNNYSNFYLFFLPLCGGHEPPRGGSGAKEKGNCVDGCGVECEGPTNVAEILVNGTMVVDWGSNGISQPLSSSKREFSNCFKTNALSSRLSSSLYFWHLHDFMIPMVPLHATCMRF